MHWLSCQGLGCPNPVRAWKALLHRVPSPLWAHRPNSAPACLSQNKSWRRSAYLPPGLPHLMGLPFTTISSWGEGRVDRTGQGHACMENSAL